MISPIIRTLLERAAEAGDKPAIVEEKRTISFAGLAAMTRRWAARLDKAGIGRGDTVMVFVTPGIELYGILLAIWWRGAIAVFADAWTTRHRLRKVIQRTEPALFIATPKARLLSLLVPALRKIPAITVWPGSRLPSGDRAPGPANIDADQTALVTFTTGSSGEPKGADRSHRFLITQHLTLLDALGDIPPGPELVTLPVFLLHALAGGRTSLLAPIPHARPGEHDPRRLLRFIRRHRPASLAASPAVCQRLADYINRIGRPCTAPVHIHIGGALVTPKIMADLRRAFPHARLTGVYGSTEAEPISLIDGDRLAGMGPEDCAAGMPVGKPYAGTRIRIIAVAAVIPDTCSESDWRGLALPPGECGEICVTGPHVVQGYFRQPGATGKTKVRVGETVWHRTGDAGFFDGDGELNIVGPVTHSFVANGIRHFGFPLAMGLESLPGIARAAVIVTPEGPVYCLERLPGAQPTNNTDLLKKIDLPSTARFWFGTLPRDPRHNAKIDYGRLSRLVETGR